MHAQDGHIFYTVNLYHGYGTTSVLFRKNLYKNGGGKPPVLPTIKFTLCRVRFFANAQNDKFV